MDSLAHGTCDRAAASRGALPGEGAHRPPAHPTAVLVTCILASSLAFVDGSVVNVALPAIAGALDASGPALQWVVNAYLLPLSALLLLGGGAGDRFGRRRLLMVGTALFGAASLGCALAASLEALVAMRLLQGVGSALLMPSSLALLGATFDGPAKGRAIGVWAASGAAFGAVGPVLGGVLIDAGSWRAIFLINLPIAALAIAMAWRFVPPDRSRGAPPLDAWGGALATLGLGAATWGLTLGAGPAGWTGSARAATGLGAALLVAFVAVQRHRGERAMMPLALFGSRGFVGLTLLTLFLYGALGALFVVVPYMLIVGAGFSGTAAGAALLPIPIVLTALSPAMGALAARTGPRGPLALGPVVVAAGFALATRVGPDADYWSDAFPALALIALGMSAAVAPLTTAVLGAVDARHAGTASGLNSAVARTGGLVATALLGSVLAAEGIALAEAFDRAMLACAGACLLASAAALLVAPARRA